MAGPKSWLFARSAGGARAAATAYTLVGSCKLQGIDPETYLGDIFDRLLDQPSRDIAALTMKNWWLPPGTSHESGELTVTVGCVDTEEGGIQL